MFTVIENNRSFLVINKHPGVAFHKDGEEEGIVQYLKTVPDIHNLYTVHRLDSMTSGLLLFAKNKDVASELSRQFQLRKVEKYYIAISDRRPKKKQGLIKGDMEKARRGDWKLTRTMKNPAITQFFSQSLGTGRWFFLLKPYTGKTHQLRVALKSIGSPVLGDMRYHKKDDSMAEADRGYLHSYALRFHFGSTDYSFVNKPDAGQYFTDDAFAQVLKKYETPWDLPWPKIKQSK